jgi:DNA polymerase III delta subunit
MIYLFCGEDAKKKHESYEKFIKSMPAGIETFFVGKNDFNQMEVESFYSGAGLFFKKCVVVFTNIFEKEETLNFVLSKLNLMGESGNDFVFLEGKLNKPVLDAFKKARAEINVFELPKEKIEKFNNFLLANAFGDKDKLSLWIYFRQAMDNGVGMEELVGVLFWKVKDMMLKKDFSKFSEAELKNFAGKLAYLLPEARKNGLDAESIFEQFLLDAF